MKLGTKLFGAFLVVCLLGAAVSAIGIRNASTINDAADLMYARDLTGLSEIKEANIGLLYVGRALRNALLAPTDALRAEEVRAPIGPLTGAPAYRVVPVGGNARILSQIEWEFAITPKVGGWPWVGALFVDTGAVFDGFQRFGWNDVRFSVGISLVRLLTQFGALSLDYAYPLVMPGQDSLVQSERWKREPWYVHFPGRIHFNWGMPISL